MSKIEFQSPDDYEKVTTLDEADEYIDQTKQTIVRKFRLQEQVRGNRKDVVAGYNEQLKHLKQELDHELGVLGGLEDRKKLLAARSGLTSVPKSKESEPAKTTAEVLKAGPQVVIAAPVVPLPGDPSLPPAPAPTNGQVVVPFPGAKKGGAKAS
jgi:hypothetical protein